MNIKRIIGGIICMAAAGLLMVLNTVLAEGKVVFMVGDANMPMLPIGGLAILGLGLIVTAWRR